MISHPKKIVFPWNMDKAFSNDKMVLRFILDKLRFHGLHVDRFRNPNMEKHGEVFAKCEKILNLIFNTPSDECPWFLISSARVSILHVMSELLPTAFALSKHVSAISVTTSELVKAIYEDSGAMASCVDVYGLVVWSDFLSGHPQLKKVEDEIFALFRKRYNAGRALVSLVYHPSTAKNSVMANLNKKSGKSFEGSLGQFVVEKSDLIILSVEPDKSTKKVIMI